ncbi:MAG: PKD domain-containing protein [Chloroflexi bacterium]|nr:PKD domain-containing protein [Chloroflexota bacterium]
MTKLKCIRTYYDGDGSVHTFTDSGGGSYTSPSGLHSKLIRNSDSSFTLWHKDGSKYKFSLSGQLQRIVDRNGNTLVFTYTSGNLTRVEDDSGLALTFAYSNGKIVSVTDPLGRQTSYEYDGSNLSKVTDALSQSTVYYYNADHVLRSAINRYGGMLNFRYSANQVVEISNSLYNRSTGLPYNVTTLYSISYGRGVTVATNSSGHRTTVQTNDSGNPISIIDAQGGISLMTWDAAMNRTGYSDANGKTYTYTYDSLGNRLSEGDPLDRREYWTWNNINSSTAFISLLTRTTDARGSSTIYTYDGKGNLVRTTDALNNTSYATYDAYGNRVIYTDFRGKSTTYTYDTHGNRLSQTDPLGNTTTFAYDAVGRTVSETEPGGRVTTYEYDANDRLLKQGNALGGETRYFYNEEGSLIKTIDPANRVIQYSYNLGGSVIKVTDAAGQVVSRVYDTSGSLLLTTDAKGGVTGMTYDSLGRVKSITDATGKTESFTYDRVGNRLSQTDRRGNTTSYEYNSVNVLTKETDALGNQTSYQYDAAGNRTTVLDASDNLTVFDYDALNRVTKMTRADVILLNVTYDANSNIASAKDARGNTTSYQYDALNRRTHVVDPLGYQTVTTYDAVGNRTSVTDRRGNATNYQHDAMGRVTTTTDAGGNATTFIYNAVGDLITRTDAAGTMTIYEYDSLGRRTKQTEATKDAQGNPVPKAATLYSYDALGNLVSQTDASGSAITYEYDALNRLTRETDALGKYTAYEYDAAGNQTKITDPSGNVTTNQYDAMNRLTKQIDALGNQTTFTYDSRGNLTGFTDARENTTGYEYDAFSRLIKITSPLGYETRYTYDAAGNAITRTDASGNLTGYVYDALNRRTRITYPDASTVDYTYDAESNVTRIASSGGAGETTDNTYDALNRILSTTVNYGSFQKTIAYTYNTAGKRATMTDPMGGVTSYTYDYAGRQLSLTDPSGDITTLEYDASGRKTKEAYPNGVVTTYAWDAAYRLLSMATKKTGGETISSFTYTYDSAGNRLSMTEGNGDVTAYVYDALSRLIRVTGPGGTVTDYTYDPAGNRLTETKGTNTTAYTYDADNRMLTAGATTYAYDNNGNMVKKTEGQNATAYQYDYENRLTRVTLPDASQVSYGYAPYGDRLTRTDSAGTAFYFYDIRDVLVEMDGAGAQVARYTHGPGIDEPVKVSRGGVSSYYHFDGLGSVTALSNSAQNTVATYRYDAFGVITQQTGSLTNPYRFTGREYDQATGLYYLRARYYDPRGGRFVSKDPWGSTLDELNQYLYALNNPVNRVDLFGGKSGYIRAAGRRYPLNDYDEDCIRRAFDDYRNTLQEIYEAGARIAKDLNNMLNQMRNQAQDEFNRSGWNTVISAFIGAGVGALVTALTANPVLGAAAGVAAGLAYDAASGSGISATDMGWAAADFLADATDNLSDSVTVANLISDVVDLQGTYEDQLDDINALARSLQYKIEKFQKDLYQAAKDSFHDSVEANCKKRKEPPVSQNPPTGPLPPDPRFPPDTSIVDPGGGPPTPPPPPSGGDGDDTTSGTSRRDIGVKTKPYIDPDTTQVPIDVTITNSGLLSATGLTLGIKVYSHPSSRKVLLVVGESSGNHVYYQQALGSLGVTYDTVFVDTQYTPRYEDGDAGTKDLKDYDVVIWESGSDTAGTLEGIAQPELETYLDNGGCLAVFGSGIMFQWQANTGTLMSDYMFADGYGKKFTGALVNGVPGTIGDGFYFEIPPSSDNYGIKGVKEGGREFFLYPGVIAGIQADSGKYITVLSTVTVDAYNLPQAADREAFMGRVLEFLDCRYRHPVPPPVSPTIPPLDPGQSATVTVTVTVPPGKNTAVPTFTGGNFSPPGGNGGPPPSPPWGPPWAPPFDPDDPPPPDDNPNNDAFKITIYVKPIRVETPIIWRFEEPGSGRPQTMGWTTLDGSVRSLARVKSPSSYNAYAMGRALVIGTVNAGTPLQQATALSWWFGNDGTDPRTNAQYMSGSGYGNNWDEFLMFPDIVIPDNSDPWLSFVARYDTELDKDIAYAEVYNPSADQWQPLAQYSGNSQGWVEGLAYEIPDGILSPLKLRFRFVSDAQNSDEDGGYPSDGAFWVDNTKVYDNMTGQVFYYNVGSDGSGPEVGLPPWGETATGVGNYWQLRERNGSWQWAAFDSQTGVWPQSLLDQLIMPVTDTTLYNSPGLFYDLEMNLPPESGDSLKIAVSSDGGQTWSYIRELGGASGEQSYSPLDLSAYKSQNFRLMFEANGDGISHTWGVYLDNITIKEYVPPQPPIALFTSSPTSTVVNQQVTYDASSSSDVDSSIVSYDWDFGDGTVATGMNVTHSYSSPWYYPVTLTVTDSSGLTDFVSMEIPVALPPNIQPTVVAVNAPDNVTENSDFTVTVDIQQVDNLDAANYSLTFDESVLRLDSVTSGVIGSTIVPVDFYNKLGVGQYVIVQNIPGLSGVTGSGHLATLRFRAVGPLGTNSRIDLSEGMLSSNTATEIPTTWIGDSVSISIRPGDANGDGILDALDITMVERVIARLDALTPGADANQDGKVNALDITKVERIIVGLD